MTESERVTALETKIGSLEERMSKVEDNTSKISVVDTQVQLLHQKLDTVIERANKKEDTSKFNLSQVIAVLGIILVVASSAWATIYNVKKTLEQSTRQGYILSDSDLEAIRKNRDN